MDLAEQRIVVALYELGPLNMNWLMRRIGGSMLEVWDSVHQMAWTGDLHRTKDGRYHLSSRELK